MSARTADVSGGGPKTAKKPRIAYFDVLRAFLPIAIVAIHVFRVDSAWSADSPRLVVTTVINALLRFAVPIFIMISGALFLDPKKNFSFKKHFKKNVLKLLICYFAWTIVYALLDLHWRGWNVGNSDILRIFVSSLFGDGRYHLWFIMMIIAMYLLVPILRKITEDRALMKYFLVIGFVFCFALPTLAEYADIILRTTGASNFPIAAGLLIGAKELFRDFSNWLGLRYVVYFVGGYYFATEDFSFRRRLSLYILGGLGTLNYVLISLLHGRIDETAFDSGVSLMGVGVAVYSIAVFVAVRYSLRKMKHVPTLISLMAKCSFGIYLIHAVFVDLYSKIIPQENVPVWGMGVATIAVYVLSFVAVWVLSKIPLLKKVI